MKLFNKTIDRQLFNQYSLGSDLSKQEVVAKIFNPFGAGTWFVINSDPEDPDYLWAIVDLGYGAEVGSVSRSDLENYRGRFGMGFERDLSFDPVNALELFQGLRRGEYYADGGNLSRDRKYLNRSQKHEVRYSQGKNRKGYGSLSFADGGGVNVGYNVFNYTDNTYATDEVFKTKALANKFIKEFRSRFANQGYYRDNRMNKINIQDIDLLAIPSDFNPFKKFADGGEISSKLQVLFEKMKKSLSNKNFNYFDKLSNEVHEISDTKGLTEKEYEVWDSLREKQNELRMTAFLGKSKFAHGGDIENFSDNQRMIMNQNVEVEHHHEELEDILEDVVPVPAWVVAKMETATQNLSDITHYLDGQKEIKKDQFEEDDDDDDDEIENKEVVEPINVSAGTKAELTKKFTDDAWGNLRGFLKGMEGIDLRDDYTFDYKDEQFEVEPIINSDQNGVSNAVFSIFDGDGEEVGEVAYSREGGKQKFTANSDYFQWNNAKFEDGGYFDGAIPNTSAYMSTYADGGEINLWKSEPKNKPEKLKTFKSLRAFNAYMTKNAKLFRDEHSKNGTGFYGFEADATQQEVERSLENLIGSDNQYADGGFMTNVYAKGGEVAKAEVLGLSKNIMGTTDIEMKISGMRKSQDFIVYPISADDTDKIITIQSSTRIGKIDLSTGRGLMSQSHSNGAYFVHFQMDKLTPFTLSETDLKDIKAHIFRTAGSKVGTRGIVSDNSGASRLFADGGFIQLNKTSLMPQEFQLVEWSLNGHSVNFRGKMYFQKGTGLMFIEKENGDIYEPKSNNKLYWRKIKEYANGGGIGFIPMDLEEDLRITAKWGGTNIKGVIGILNAMIDSGLTDEDLKPKPTKSGFAYQNAVEKKTKEIWGKIEPKYTGDFKGNMYYSTIRHLVERANTSDNILKRFKPFRKLQKDSYADGGSFDDFDGITYAKTKGRNAVDWDKKVREYAGSDYENLTKEEYEDIVSFLQRDWDRSYSYANGGFMNDVYADGGQIRVGDRFKYDWTDGRTGGERGYDVVEVVKNNVTSSRDFKTKVMVLKVVESSEPSHIGRLDEDYKPSFKKAIRLGMIVPLQERKRKMVDEFYAKGGMSKFEKLSDKVAKQYEGKPVKKEYQDEYGKVYSKEEAKEVGDKVAGKVKAMQTDKKAFGGLFGGAKKLMTPSKKYPNLSGKQGLLKSGKYVQVFQQKDNKVSVIELGKIGSGVRPHFIDISEVDIDSFKAGGEVAGKRVNGGTEMLKRANELAKEIRKDGESWLDAKKRAFAQLKK